MTAERPVTTEIRTDYLGEYTAYTYADGHVETYPAGRPVTQADAQRLRRAAARTGQNSLRAQEAAATSADVTLAPFRAMTQPVHDSLNALSTLAETTVTPAAIRAQLVDTVDLGGRVVGPRAGLAPEYGQPTDVGIADPADGELAWEIR